jgi:hypothetical protein
MDRLYVRAFGDSQFVEMRRRQKQVAKDEEAIGRLVLANGNV